MSDSPHDHARPGVPEQRAVLRVNRALLRGADPQTARQAAGDAAYCPECAVRVAVAFGINLAETMTIAFVKKLAPGAVLDTRPLRAAILDVIDDTERELDSGLN